MHWSSLNGVVKNGLRAQSTTLVGSKLFVIGGVDSNDAYCNLRIFDTETMCWQPAVTTGVTFGPHRAHSSALYHNKIFVFGGGDGPHYFKDLYVLDTMTLVWSKPEVKGSPPGPRRAHTANVRGHMIFIFGGGNGAHALNDVYALDAESLVWRLVSVSGTVPSPRGYHSSCVVGDRLFVFGGSDGLECFGDVYTLDLINKRWEKLDPGKTLPLLAHTSTAVGPYIFVFGGHDGADYVSCIRILNTITNSWWDADLHLTGDNIVGRGYHATVFFDSRLFVLGGYDGSRIFDNLLILDLENLAYLPYVSNVKLISASKCLITRSPKKDTKMPLSDCNGSNSVNMRVSLIEHGRPSILSKPCVASSLSTNSTAPPLPPRHTTAPPPLPARHTTHYNGNDIADSAPPPVPARQPSISSKMITPPVIPVRQVSCPSVINNADVPCKTIKGSLNALNSVPPPKPAPKKVTKVTKPVLISNTLVHQPTF